MSKRPRIRCLFIEKDPAAYRALEAAVAGAVDVGAQPLRGEFEQVIPDVLRFVDGAFSLVFIDPTGWTGFGLKQIAPILQHRPGEVLINFMFDHVNRFLDDARSETKDSFDALFGGAGWKDVLSEGPQRERAILDLYRERLRVAGDFPHVTSTRILKPMADRAYFHLVYGTRHPKGLLEFRRVERKAVDVQEQVRLGAKQEGRVGRTGQAELFAPATMSSGPPTFEQERASQLDAARRRLDGLLLPNHIVPYEQAFAALLEMPYVWEGDVKALVMELRAAGDIEIRGLEPRERTPKPGHSLVRLRRP